MSLESKILFIQSSVDTTLRLILDTNWNSKNKNYRQEIRTFLADKFSSHFSRQQLAELNDLNKRPEASDVFISVSHCGFLGGFALSQFKVGFDAEESSRISEDILKRVCAESELQECPWTEFLWVAKEAGFKALSQADTALVIGDLQCYDWKSYFENQVFSFRLKSKKTLDFGLNKGFIFSEEPCLYGLFFK
ncbi:MAG: 4'-phosphopantetheinyl transferase superfamily protein [Bdellovibrionota bacterium]